jgi:hypothetical protein
MDMRHRRIVAYFGGAGFMIAALLYLLSAVIDAAGMQGFLGDAWQWVLWPTAFLMMAADGYGPIGGLLGFVISTSSNAVVYALVGGLVAFFFRRGPGSA